MAHDREFERLLATFASLSALSSMDRTPSMEELLEDVVTVLRIRTIPPKYRRVWREANEAVESVKLNVRLSD